jgi:hypothetical protein
MLAGMRRFERLTDAGARLGEIARNHPTADTVMTVQILRGDVNGADFWIHYGRRNGSSNSERYQGTWDELKQKGFDHEIEGNGPNAQVYLSLARYFAKQLSQYEILEGPKETPTLAREDHSPCYFLRRLPTDEPKSDAE